MDSSIDLKSVVEANPRQLTNWLLIETDRFSTELAYVYAKIRHSTLLGGSFEQIQKDPNYLRLDPDQRKWIDAIGEVRQQIVLRKISSRSLESLLQVDFMSRLVAGESFCVAARAKNLQKEFVQAKELNDLSYRAFKEANAMAKAMTALQNSIAMSWYINPKKKLINEFQFLADEAKKYSISTVQGMALSNLSNEYQNVGAFEKAYVYAKQAVEVLSTEVGSHQHGLAYLQLAEVCVKVKDFDTYESCLQELRISTFDSIKEASKVIEVIRTGRDQSIDMSKLEDTWIDRYEAALERPNINLGRMESTLIRSLIEKPRSKYELIESLYGNVLEIEVLENRFKNLLARVRKKCPGLIECKNSHYQVKDPLSAERIAGGDVG